MQTNPWIIVIVGVMSGCTGPPDDTTSAAIAALGPPSCDPVSVPGKELAPGVKYYDCSTARDVLHSFPVRAHVVTVDRTLPAMEIRLLTEPAPDLLKAVRGKEQREFWLELQRVDTFARRSGAVAAVNGFVWDGDSGKLDRDQPVVPIGIPVTSFYLDHQLQSTHQQVPQVLMGFTRGGPAGIGARFIRQAHEFDADSEPFKYQLYGSGTTVVANRECLFATGNPLPYFHVNDRWSFVGYSDTQIVFLSSSDDPNFQQDFCSIFKAFDVTDAVRQDGGHSPSLYVGGDLNKVVNRLGQDCDLENDPLACTAPVLFAQEFGAVPRVAFAVGVVPTATVTACRQVTDSATVVIGMLCITPDNSGYDAQFIALDRGPPRCGLFDFILQPINGELVRAPDPFIACTNDAEPHSHYFRTGTLGGCATLQLFERSGNDFGRTTWEQPSCGSTVTDDGGGGGSGPVDTTPPVTTATFPSANSNGWNNTSVTVEFSAIDPGVVASGVRAIHVTLTGAQTGTTVLPGTGGAITVNPEGTTRVTYFAIDNAGNIEPSRSLALNIDRTPPTITGMPGADCSLWPPNHKFVGVATVTAADELSGMALFDVTGESSEPPDHQEPDVVITGTDLDPRDIQLRAERAGGGSGRTYSLTATATDQADNVATVQATCTVAHDQGN